MDLTPLKEAFKDFPEKAKEALKNFPEFLKGSFKIYPLLVMTISASLVLAIVFAFMKDGSESSISTTAPAVTTTISSDITTLSQSGIGSSVSGFVDSTETAPVPVREFQSVEDDYFHDALFIGNSRTVGLSMFGSMPDETTFYATVGMNIFDLMDSSAQIPPEEGPEHSFTSLLSEKQFG
ncbi:MAG: hypothetical protein IJY74_04450 [Oscillospiraceae bacterium]|nr:hypothetical protein [Oscillospiraceae bacterium]